MALISRYWLDTRRAQTAVQLPSACEAKSVAVVHRYADVRQRGFEASHLALR
jgi:hypothetical protein